MDKPITLIINDLKLSIEKAITESGLPPCVVEPILNSYWLQVKSAADKKAEDDLNKYLHDIQEKTE